MTRKQHQEPIPRPVLKWAGGKQFSLPHILSVIPEKFVNYHEPFFGGGAVFFALKRAGLIKNEAYISDCNRELFETLCAIKSDLPLVLSEIEKLNPSVVTEESYYQVRSSKPSNRAAVAARMLFLNKCGYCGLYRVNKKLGEFNVPWGKRVKWDVDVLNISAVSVALKNTTITRSNFVMRCEDAEKGDVVYLDPPYFPVSKTANFTAYSRDGFTYSDQLELAAKFAELAAKKVCVIASNADVPIVHEIYGAIKGVTIRRLEVPRRINSNGKGRGLVGELLIYANGRKGA